MRGVERSVWAVPGRGNSICQGTEAAVDVKRMIFSVEWEQVSLQGKNHGSGGRQHSWHR